jgi:hypothetical protein
MISGIFKDVEYNWPYDNGDDPSFYSMRSRGGRLTWGVCRPDIRNPINKGDIVVFFSFQKDKRNKEMEYRFCSVATVEDKVSQADVWQKEELKVFRNYNNLLVKPSNIDGVWKHFEPTLKGRHAHKHWLWRCTKHGNLKKNQFIEISKTNVFKQGYMIEGVLIEFAKNYIIFSSDPTKTFHIANPKVVAKYKKGMLYEDWRNDKFSQEIKSLVLEKAEHVNKKKRNLRINNNQRPHRHIMFKLTASEAVSWRAKILQFLSKQGVKNLLKCVGKKKI